MGEAAEIALHGEAFGITDPLEAALDFFAGGEETDAAAVVQTDVFSMLGTIEAARDDDTAMGSAQALQAMFPHLSIEMAQRFVQIAEVIRAHPVEDDHD